MVPVIGSVLLQLLYFWGVGESIDAGLFTVWVSSNLFLTFIFSGIGGLMMFLILKYRQKKENSHHTRKEKKNDSSWINRVIATVILVFYLITHGVLAIPVAAASPDCTKKLTPEEFLHCYDPEKEYEPDPEASVPEPVRRIPLTGEAGGTGGASGAIPLEGGTAGSANAGASLEEYYRKYPAIPPEQINELYAMCLAEACCTFEELIEAYAIETASLAVYEHETTEYPNLFLAPFQGLAGVGQDIWSFVTTEGGKGLNYLKENWNNPKKMFDDARWIYGEFQQAYQEGQHARLREKKNEAKGIVDLVWP
ncbi:MAG: hypothetical protein N2691_00765 [Patescibacteria group bacterium]|nr:hypothetical protein [Patescibacteria group bacterium]